jgi:hypothetical protein
MSGFNEREQSFERKFEHDQELAFKARARRDKLFGLWAAEKLGLGAGEAEAYAQKLVGDDLGRHGEERIIAAVLADFTAKGVPLDAVRLKVELDQLLAEAMKQVEAGH